MWLWVKFLAESRALTARYADPTIRVQWFTLSPQGVGYVTWVVEVGEEYPKNYCSMIPRGA